MFSYAKKILSIIGIGLLAGCAASGPSISTPVRPGATVATPAYQNGDQWAYQIVRSTGNDDKLKISYRNGKFENDNQAAFDNYFAATVYRTDRDLKPLNFPLGPGKSWSYRYQGTSARGRTMWRDAEVKVNRTRRSAGQDEGGAIQGGGDSESRNLGRSGAEVDLFL
jgi:hypothetical protein